MAMTPAIHQMLFNAALEGGMMDFERLINLCNVVIETEHVSGSICEFGVYRGQTAALMDSLKGRVYKRDMFLYDSFDGLSEPGPYDLDQSPYRKGDMASRVETVLQTFEAAGLKEPNIIKEDVRNLHVSHLPDSISVAHIDLDLEAPTLAVLKLIWPFVSIGGVVVVDDYGHKQLPGVKHAVDEFKAWLDMTRLNKEWHWGWFKAPIRSIHCCFHKS